MNTQVETLDVLTRITIRATSTETLKASALWQEIMGHAFNGGAVEVIGIQRVEADAVDEVER